MVRKFFVVLIFTILLCLACGCSRKEEMTIEETTEIAVSATKETRPIVIEEETKAPVTTVAETTVVETSAIETTAAYDLFADLQGRIFEFSSGVGGWATELEVFPDGTFKGNYHDSDMGDSTEEYPDGTIYTCAFTGKFSDPIKVDDHTFTTKVKELKFVTTYDDGSDTQIADGMRWVLTTPYGLSQNSEVEIYNSGKSISELDDTFKSWTIGRYDENAKALTGFAICSKNDEAVFFENNY